MAPNCYTYFMASMNNHQSGYRVAWYDEDNKHHQKYFYGPDAHEDAKSLKYYMDEKYPSRRPQNIIRKKSSRNKSGMVGVFREDGTYNRKGILRSNPSWNVSIRVDSDGNKCRKVISFYDRSEGSEEVAFAKACECRKLYNQCIENGKISTFWKINQK